MHDVIESLAIGHPPSGSAAPRDRMHWTFIAAWLGWPGHPSQAKPCLDTHTNPGRHSESIGVSRSQYEISVGGSLYRYLWELFEGSIGWTFYAL